MLKRQFPLHFFHAHGCAFGAEFTKPFAAVVESQAATAISSIGGHAHTSVAGFNFKELVRIEHASTQIAAMTEEDSFDTVVTCRLEGVNIFNQFTADQIVAHLSVKTGRDGRAMAFRTVGTRFVNLRVGGIALKPVIVHECGDDYHTGKCVNRVFDVSTKTEIPQHRESPRGFLTTLVSDVGATEELGCVQPMGNAIYVPDFGVVYLAEYLVTPYARHLNMFRIQFGCGVDGRSSGGGVGANGQTCPPPST